MPDPAAAAPVAPADPAAPADPVLPADPVAPAAPAAPAAPLEPMIAASGPVRLIIDFHCELFKFIEQGFVTVSRQLYACFHLF